MNERSTWFVFGFVTSLLWVILLSCTDDPKWTDEEQECADFMQGAIERAADPKVSEESRLQACREYIDEYGPYGRWTK